MGNKIKWMFSFCIAAFIVFGSASGVSAWTNDDGIKYEINDDGTVSVTGYDGESDTVAIPSEIDGKRVKEVIAERGYISGFPYSVKHITIESGVELSYYAFFDCMGLESVTLPEGITVLGEGAFCGSENLRDINFPSTVQTIEKNIFRKCYKLKNVEIQDGCTTIKEGAFSEISDLNITLPDSVTNIDDKAFEYSSRLTIHANPDSYAREFADAHGYTFSCIEHGEAVYMPAISPTCMQEGYTEGTRCAACQAALSGCETIPKSKHKMIEVYIAPTCTEKCIHYAYCEMCRKQEINEDGKFYHYLDDGAPPLGHRWDGGKFESGLKIYTCTACGATKSETIPSSDIPESGSKLTEPSASYTVTKPGSENGTVEYSKMRLAKNTAVIPDTVNIGGIEYKVTSIAKDAFKNNKNIKKVTIGSNVSKINAGAFSGCMSLKTVTIKSGNIKSVGKNAFKGIRSDAKIKVPANRLKKYAKLFSGKGQKSTVKVTK